MAYSINAKDHFQVKTYTGTGSSNVLTGVGFSPDLIWTATLNEADIRPINDSVNGINNYLRSNDVDTLETGGTNITAQSSDGYTVGTNDRFNQSSNSFVSWNWKANGAGSANTDGSTNTTATSANTTAGISIIKYPGTGSSATIGHSLGVTPSVLWFKQLDGLESWRVWSIYQPNYSSKALALNLNNQEFSQTNYVGTVNNSTIALGSDGSINLNAKNYVCYAFAEKTGFSKFGVYTGNGQSGDGAPFIYTGFKVGWLMVKKTTDADSWVILDNKRDVASNPRKLAAFADNTDVQAGDYLTDFCSNGFKIRSATGSLNTSSGKYIYQAFAEAPLVGSNNIAATAG